MIDYKDLSMSINLRNPSTEKKDKSSSYAWKAGIGGEYFLTQNWAVNSEAVLFYEVPLV